tara:strand:+ start:2624 stop:2911 length:288 start_codon:yes stop_codon:yes gene_type:complete
MTRYRSGVKDKTPKGSSPTSTTKKKKGLTNEQKERRSKLAAALSDASKTAGDMAGHHKGGTHTPSGSGGVKSGASHNAKFLEVWHSGYKLEEPNM